MNPSEILLITGASTRAAAYSALRAGLAPTCVDLYADRDLRAVARCERIPLDQPIPALVASFVAAAKRHAPSAWLYTGSFENYPDQIDEIGSVHRLWGNPGSVLRAARDPFRLADSLNQAGLASPDIRPDPRGLPRDGSWLVKPLASGGGAGIGAMTDQTRLGADSVYYQRRVPGRSYSALYLGAHSRASMIGVSRQFHGVDGQPFVYRGSVGPVRLSSTLEAQLVAIGDRLAAEFGLIGIFGIDFVIHEGRAWVLELNPRYTASVEIFELAVGSSLLLEHRRVCDSELPEQASRPLRGPRVVGKWIVYATRRLIFPDLPIRTPRNDQLYEIPEVADVPDTGLVIDRGRPVLTVFGSGAGPRQCLASLRTNVNQWRRRLGLGP
jgi:predicted ATP-grasp superfamily ATP-dependent carboligase